MILNQNKILVEKMNDLHIIILKLIQLLFKRNCVTKTNKHSFLTPYAYLVQNYIPRTINSILSYKKANSQALTTASTAYFLWNLESHYSLVL